MKIQSLLEADNVHLSYEQTLFTNTSALLSKVAEMCEGRLSDKLNITDEQVDDYNTLRNKALDMISTMKHHLMSYE